MIRRKQSWLIAALTFVLWFSGGAAVGQAQAPFDPWQFPEITNSKPFQRWWWFYQQRAYPLGNIPEGAKLRALREIVRFKAAARAAGAAAPEVQGNAWINIGPAPILGEQIDDHGTTRAMSSRVESIAVDPSDDTHWLIGAAQGGVWETRDAGTTWTPKTDDQASLAMGAIAFAKSNPNIIYAGTGEAAFSGDSYAGAGMLRSTDGGTTWTLVGDATFGGIAFSDVKVHPTSPDVVVVATTVATAGRGADGLPSPPTPGIYKTINGLNRTPTWQLTLSGQATDIEVHPNSKKFKYQYAGIGKIDGDLQNNGVYRSTDVGSTWTKISGPWPAARVGRVELAIAPSDANVLYVSIQDVVVRGGDGGGLLGLWKTTNAWATSPSWTQISTAATGTHGYCEEQCWYNHDIIVDPYNSNILYAGGIKLWKFDGSTWAEVGTDPGQGMHVDQHALAWAGTRLIAGNDGGVWSTMDGGATWADHNTTLAITQFYDGSIHPEDPNFALGGSQDNGTEKWTGDDAWQSIYGGDGADNAIANIDPYRRWAASSQHLAIGRTTDGGANWIQATSGLTDADDQGKTPFIARFEKCPANDDIFIAGSDNLWKSTNFFSALNPTWSANGPEMGWPISAMAFAASDRACNTYAFGTSTGALHLTTDGGSSWANIDAGNGVPGRYVTDLAFDPNNANILYVTLSGFDEFTSSQPGHVFKTTNALAGSPTWSNVSPPVNIPHNTIVVDPSDSNIIYVGTDIGVWKNTAGGASDSWTHFGPDTGMPNVAVFDLQINATTNRLVAFTHGRGAFALSQNTSPCSSIQIVAAPARAGAAGDSGSGPSRSTDTVVGATTFPSGISPAVTGDLPPGGVWTHHPRDGGETWAYHFNIPDTTQVAGHESGGAPTVGAPRQPPADVGIASIRIAGPSAPDAASVSSGGTGGAVVAGGGTATSARQIESSAQPPNLPTQETRGGNLSPAATLDIVANRAFPRTAAAGGGSEVSTPALGQTVYFHLDWQVVGTGSPMTVNHRALLDGVPFCSFPLSVSPGPWTSWCNSGWSATAGTHTLQWDLDYNNTVAETNESNNSAALSWITGAGLDIVANRAFLLTADGIISTPSVGQMVRFLLDLEIIGTGGPVLVDRRALLDGATYCSDSVLLSVPTGLTTWCSDSWAATAGPHTLQWDLDYNNTVAETNEGNNSAATSWTTPGLDVEAQRAYLRIAPGGGSEVGAPVVGQTVYFHLDWRITGMGGPVSVDQRAVLDGGTFCSGSLSASVGEVVTAWCTGGWMATLGPHTLQWDLDYNNTVAETNESNNSAATSWTTSSGLDIEARRAYLRTASGGGGTEVSTPTAGQPVFFHLDWRVTGFGSTVGVSERAMLDGEVFCSCQQNAAPGTSYISSCTNGWPATVGPHTLRWELDYDNTVTETNEWNNAAAAAFGGPTITPRTPRTFPPTATPTATPPRTPTAAPTRPPTSTRTAAPTKTPIPTMPPHTCGNGVLEPGEQCDDGNLTTGDGCDATCRYELIPGGSSDDRACLVEWSVVNPNNVPKLDRRGHLNLVQRCKNNDPTCDFGSDPNTCEFQVVVCVNNVDPNLGSCRQLGVADPVAIISPNRVRDAANYSRLVSALHHLRDPVTGQTDLTLPVQSSQTNLCSAPFPITVRARRWVALRTLSKSWLNSPSMIDSDRLFLLCRP